MTHYRRTIRTLAALLVLTSALAATGIASPVAAQTQSNNSTTNSSSPGGDTGNSPGSGDWSHWTNASNTSAGGNGGFSLGIGPKEWASEIVDFFKEKIGNMFRWALRASMSLWIGSPYAHMGANGVPTNEPFTTLHKKVYGAYIFPAIVLFLGMFIMMSAAAMSASTIFSRGRITRWLGRLGMAVIVVGLAYNFTNLMQHLANSVAWAFAPTPKDLTSSLDGVLKLGVGPAVGVMGLYLTGTVQALSLALVYGFRQLVLLFAPIMMPIILLVAYAAPHARLRMLGSMLFWQWFGLVWVSLPVAILLRVAYELEWSFGVGGLIGFFLTLAIFAIALILPFVISYGFFKFPPSVTTSAAAVGGAAASKANAMHQRYDRYRNQDNDDVSVTPNSSTASPQDRAVAADGGITEGQTKLLADRLNRDSRISDTQTAERIRAIHDTNQSSEPRIRTKTRKHVVRTRRRARGTTSTDSTPSKSNQVKPRYRLRLGGGDD